MTYQTFDRGDLDNTFTFDLRWQSIFSYYNKFHVLAKARQNMWAKFPQLSKKHPKIARKMNFTVES